MSIDLRGDELDRLLAQHEEAAELDRLVSAGLLIDALADDATPSTSKTPWPALDGRFELRLGELTVWGGESGSGKSLLLGQVMTHLLAREHRVVIASLEMRLTETLRRMINQAAGCHASGDFCREFCTWADGRLWLYDELDTVASDRLVAMCRVAASHLHATHVVIDSLTKAGVPHDGNGYLTAQTRFVDRLQRVAKSHDVHIHLVTHLRKPAQAQGSRPSKFDIRGASQITDLADNVVLISRNHAKEELRQLPREALEPADLKVLEQSDAWLDVAKQRYTGWEGRMSLDFHAESGQFVRHKAGKAQPWPAPGFPEPWKWGAA